MATGESTAPKRGVRKSTGDAGIKEKMLADVERSALTAQDATKLKLKLVTAAEAQALKLPSATDGYQIPYFDADGRVTSFFRVRYLSDTRKGFEAYTTKKPIKYGQVPGTINEIYMAPLINWRKIFSNPEIPLIITEGEKKAACATKHGLPTLGLGGVWCFMSSRSKKALLPIFDEIQLEGREVIICFDSDAATNSNIVAAENRLAQRLLERGALVYIARLTSSGENKVGMDDYIVAHGVEALKAHYIDTAFEYATSEALHAMSQSVVYVRDPGLIHVYDSNMQMRSTDFTGHAFSNAWHYETQIKADGGEKMVRVATAKAWMEWEHRAELRGMTYAPGMPKITHDGYLNTWEGWGFDEPKKGDIRPWSALLDHLFGDDKIARTWFERWLAYPIQHPGTKLSTASLVWGVTQGSGKTLVGHMLMRLYGENGTEIKDADLSNPRCEWAERKQFVLADDITGSSNRQLANKLKTMVTQKTVRIDKKFVPSYTVRDCINYYFTSNDPDALFLDDGDRRYFVHEVRSGKLPLDTRRAFVDFMESDEGVAALAWHFIHLDMGDFDPKADALETEAKRFMRSVGKSELGAWVAKLKDAPEAVLPPNMGDLFTADELHAIYDPTGDKRASPNALARELKRAGFEPPGTGSPVRTADGMKRVYAMFNCAEWKQRKGADAAKHYDEHRATPGKKRAKF